MNKNTFYLVTIVALLVANVILLVLHFRPPNRPNEPKKIVIDRLKFDDEQIQKYEALIVEHRKKVVENTNQINILKNNLYQELNKSTDSLKINDLAENMAQLEKKAIIVNFRHFEDIKKICKPNQKEEFESLAGDLAEIFSKKHLPKRKDN